jgi:hypothetical protein
VRVQQLFEKKPEATEWVTKVDVDYKHVLRSLGFTDTTKPTVKRDNPKQAIDGSSWWRFGGFMRQTDKDEVLGKEDRMKIGVKALPTEIAKFLLKMAQTGRMVRVIDSPSYWRENQHIVREDDALSEVERIVRIGFKDRIRQREPLRGVGYDMFKEPYFQWEMEPPKNLAPEEPRRRIVRVVKKAAA